MAKVTVIQPPPVIPEPEYDLRLTQEEANILFLVTGKVSGDPATTVRGIVDKIYWALRNAGIKYPTKSSIYGETEDYSTFDGQLIATK
jgi:hypothetical protein